MKFCITGISYVLALFIIIVFFLMAKEKYGPLVIFKIYIIGMELYPY